MHGCFGASKNAVVVLDLPVQDKCQANDNCRKNDIGHHALIPKCRYICQHKRYSHNECSCADRFPVFRNVLLLHFSPVVGMYRTDIPPYIYDTEDGYTYPQNQQHHIFHSNLHSAAFQLAAQIVMKVFQLSTLCCKIVCKKLHYKAREEEL